MMAKRREWNDEKVEGEKNPTKKRNRKARKVSSEDEEEEGEEEVEEGEEDC
jgi:hypothetical protein